MVSHAHNVEVEKEISMNKEIESLKIKNYIL